MTRNKRVSSMRGRPFGGPVFVLALSALLVGASSARAFEYVVEGAQPRRVVVSDPLLQAGLSAAVVGYAIPLIMGGLFFTTASFDGTPAAQHNAGVGFALSAPPVVNGALLGSHLLDSQEAYDSREGWAALPAIALWGATAAQVIGLAIIGGAFIMAPRVPVGE